jgi:hypothetical protein
VVFPTATVSFFSSVDLPLRSKKQALTWGVQGWQKDSHARTEEFRNHGPRGPCTWVLVDGKDKIPNSALEAGKDKDGHPIYIARAYYEDSIRTFDPIDCFGGSLLSIDS